VTRATLDANAEGLELFRQCSEGNLIFIPPATSHGKPDFDTQDKVQLPVRIYYMVGNHDWHYHLPGPAFDAIRQEIIDVVGLSNPVDCFPWEIDELEPLQELFSRHEAYGRHGDKFDIFNYDPSRGRDSAALGDAFAMEILNRYPVEASREFGEELPPELVDGLRRITNVRPALATPLWIAGLIRQTVQQAEVERRLKAVWDQLGEEFLELDFVRSFDKAFQLDVVDAFKVIVTISSRASFKTFNEIAAWAYQKMGGGEISYTRHALNEPAFKSGKARYLLYGHTHHHEVVPLDIQGFPPSTAYQIYMNSGTWHSYYALTAKEPKDQKFVPYQMLTYLILYEGDQRGGRHFEAWSGTFV
jgi:hypothetical protein